MDIMTPSLGGGSREAGLCGWRPRRAR
jgi:hypothetical protein